MVSIPTIIPESWATSVRQWMRQSLPLMLWRLILLIGATALFFAAVSNGWALVATVLGIVFSVIYADDITTTWRDLWNLNFWTIDP